MLKKALKEFNLDYVDLYLVHWPFGFKETASEWPAGEGSSAYSDVDYLETWEGMEECVNLGLTKSIGISNFNSEQIDRLYQAAKIKPVCNQIEAHVNFSQKSLIDFCKQKNIAVAAYCPLGRPEGDTSRLAISDLKVAEIGKKYGKTAAQVALNYLVKKILETALHFYKFYNFLQAKVLRVSVIPKSVTKSRIIENFNILDFDLSKEEIEYMDSLNCNMRIVALRFLSDHKYYPFNIDF